MASNPDPVREPDVESAVRRHLEEAGYQVRSRAAHESGIIDLVAANPTEELVIEAKGEDRGGYTSAEMNFQMGLGQLISRMTDKTKTYCLAFPLTADFARVLRKYRAGHALERLGVHAFVYSRDTSTVRRMNPSELQTWIDGDAQ